MKREPIRITYKLKFEGGDADRHQLEAYPAAQSLEGIIWALSITLNYGVTGKIRQRGDLSGACKVYISPPKRGSVLYELNILVQDNAFIALILGGWAVNTATPYINALIGHVFNSALGVASEIPVRARKYLNKLNEDDLQKVVHRIEPPLTRGHAAIGKTAATVSLRAKNTDLVVMDEDTKSYLEARLKDEFYYLDANVTSFNVLTGNGRLYHPDEDRTVAFSLSADPFAGTKNILIESMKHYSAGRCGIVRMTTQRVETKEGRLKKLMVASAEEIPQSDWEDGVDPLRSKR
ncbi:hypothetical protein MWN63_13170 [Paradonghicola geojensis]|jgi:hypothetical protein|nr:hypothetical protein [Marivivens geojensis]